MKTLIVSLFYLLVSVPLAQAQSEENAVRASCTIYKEALLAGNGSEAVSVVDRHTLDYYQMILDLTLGADSTQVDALELMDKLIVLRVRDLMTLEEVLAMDSSSFFAYAVDQGMIGKEGVANLQLGTIEVQEEFAKGQVISNGQPAPIYFHFFKEQGTWKIDLTSIFPASAAAFRHIVTESRLKENEFIFQILEMITGKAVSNAVWHPLAD